MKLNAHICKNCGAALTFLADVNDFRCDFCGAVYTDDVIRDSLLERGLFAMQNREFISAHDDFTTILQQNPHNTAVIRGLILTDNKLSDMAEFIEDPEYQFQRTDMWPYVERAPEAYQDYFYQYLTLAEKNKRCRALLDDVLVAKKNRKQLTSRFSLYYGLVIGGTAFLCLLGLAAIPEVYMFFITVVLIIESFLLILFPNASDTLKEISVFASLVIPIPLILLYIGVLIGAAISFVKVGKKIINRKRDKKLVGIDEELCGRDGVFQQAKKDRDELAHHILEMDRRLFWEA